MRRSGMKIMLRLIGLVKPMLHIMLGAILMGIAGNLCASFIPVLGVTALAGVLDMTIPVTLSLCLGLMIIFALLRGILRYAEQACNHYIAFKLLALIRHKVFAALRKLAPAKLETREKGNLISLITNDIELLEVFYAHTISPIIIASGYSLLMVLFIGSFSWLAAAAALAGYLIIGVIIPVRTSKDTSKTGMSFREEFGQTNSFFLESIRGIRESIQYGQGEKRLSAFLERTERLEMEQRKLKISEGKTRALTDTVIWSVTFIVLGLLLFSTSKGRLSASDILICTAAVMSSFGPVVALSNLSADLTQTLASGERVLSLMEEEAEVEEVEHGVSVENFGLVSCEEISFDYGEDTIIDHYTESFKTGQITGIYGRSGSGKSTLLKLLMRFWDTKNGRVSVNDSDVKDIRTGSLRSLQGYMTQETYLFQGTIADNIRVSRPNAPLEDIMQAAKMASLHEWVMEMPHGYETKVGELGEKLSGGERQRIGLARAFLHDAPLMLLDEPTSNLDSLNEAVILKSIKKASDNKTVIIVSHRKSAFRITDRILEMKTSRSS